MRTLKFLRIPLILSVGSLAWSVAGCGGGSGAGPAFNSSKAAFLPNFASETDPQTQLPNKLLHWPKFPVRLFVASANVTPETRNAALQGTTWWVKALGRVGAFTVATDPASADITVSFKDNGSNGFSGQTLYTYDNQGTLVKADISLNLSYLGDDAEFTHAAAHEMGHALGIGGHSNDPDDLMSFSPTIFQIGQPSLRDLNTMKTGYIDLYDSSSTGRAAAGTLHTSVTVCPAFKR